MFDGSDALGQAVVVEQEAAAAMRGTFEQAWEQIAARILPNYVSQFQGQNRGIWTPGVQNTQEMVDATGALALTRFAAAMESMLTPRSSLWHSLLPSDGNLMKDRETRLWFEEVTKLLFRMRYAPNANFASQKHEDYMMLGAFGTGNLFIDALQSSYERGLRYRAVHLGQTYFQENHQGIIDRVFRRFSLTARQAVQQFGEKLPEEIAKQASDPKRSTTPHWFIHRVSPREDYDPQRRDGKGMRYQSVYVSLTKKVTVREGGYHSFPYAVSRYVTTPGELYGRSPAMMALPAIKSLNEMKKTMLKQGHRTVDPVLLAHDDGILDTFSMRPGAVNPGGVNAEGRPLVHALPTGNLAAGKDSMEEEKGTINEFFLVTLFQILVETPQMTATEVIERAREKGALLSPTMGRQQSESLGPMIERELDVLRELRLLPEMPPALIEARGQYTVQYESPLSRMARAEEASGFMRTLDYLKEVVQVTQNPDPLDYFNWDVAVPALMDIHGVPPSWRNSVAQVESLRQGRSEQADQQKMLDAAPALSSAMKTVMPKPAEAPAAA